MAPRKIKNVLLMIVNVGETSLEQNSYEEEPFLDKAKCAMKLLIEKKIFLQPKDEIGIITMGDVVTKNPENIDYVKNYEDHLLVPNWEMVRYVNQLNSTKKPCNWVEAVHVALNFIHREVMDPAYKVFLVMFNNFREPEDSISSYDPEVICGDARACSDLHMLFVGENPLNDEEWREENASFSEQLAMKIMEGCNGQYEQINSFIEERRFFIPPATHVMPWKFDLEIAEICIPCSSYVKINEELNLESWKMKAIEDSEELLNASAGDDLLPSDNDAPKVVRENIRLDAQRNEVHCDEIINGYKYGGQYIPVSEEDEAAMKYEGGPKSMCVYGFVPQNEIKLEYWCGKGSRIIVPQAENHASVLYSLVQAMVEKEYVAIVRKVHADNYLPRMGVLFPKVVDDDIWCLVHLELPYNDEVRVIDKIIDDKEPIESLSENVIEKNLKAKKLKALDGWIDSMTVPHEEMTYLNPGFYPNIPHQYHWNAMAERAANPKEPLIHVQQYLQQYLVPLSELSQKARIRLEKLNRVFGWSHEPVAKKMPNIVAEAMKDTEKIEVIVFRKDKAATVEKSSTDEGFFSPEDIDMETGELDSM